METTEALSQSRDGAACVEAEANVLLLLTSKCHMGANAQVHAQAERERILYQNAERKALLDAHWQHWLPPRHEMHLEVWLRKLLVLFASKDDGEDAVIAMAKYLAAVTTCSVDCEAPLITSLPLLVNQPIVYAEAVWRGTRCAWRTHGGHLRVRPILPFHASEGPTTRSRAVNASSVRTLVCVAPTEPTYYLETASFLDGDARLWQMPEPIPTPAGLDFSAEDEDCYILVGLPRNALRPPDASMESVCHNWQEGGRASLASALPSESSCDGDTLEIGTTCKVRYLASSRGAAHCRRWYRGVIKEVCHDSGTYAIAYDDGDQEELVQRRYIAHSDASVSSGTTGSVSSSASGVGASDSGVGASSSASGDGDSSAYASDSSSGSANSSAYESDEGLLTDAMSESDKSEAGEMQEDDRSALVWRDHGRKVIHITEDLDCPRTGGAQDRRPCKRRLKASGTAPLAARRPQALVLDADGNNVDMISYPHADENDARANAQFKEGFFAALTTGIVVAGVEETRMDEIVARIGGGCFTVREPENGAVVVAATVGKTAIVGQLDDAKVHTHEVGDIFVNDRGANDVESNDVESCTSYASPDFEVMAGKASATDAPRRGKLFLSVAPSEGLSRSEIETLLVSVRPLVKLLRQVHPCACPLPVPYVHSFVLSYVHAAASSDSHPHSCICRSLMRLLCRPRTGEQAQH